MTKLEIKINIDQIEEDDAYELLEMFKTMCAYSGCIYSTYETKSERSK